jgi:hypothetical protein
MGYIKRDTSKKTIHHYKSIKHIYILSFCLSFFQHCFFLSLYLFISHYSAGIRRYGDAVICECIVSVLFPSLSLIVRNYNDVSCWERERGGALMSVCKYRVRLCLFSWYVVASRQIAS